MDPDRQFLTWESMKGVAPVKFLKKDEKLKTVTGCLYGESRFGKGEVRLTWYEGELTIEAN